LESLICICGAGTMGRGIALAASMQGVSVILYDLNPDMLAQAGSAIEAELNQAHKKNRISAEEKENQWSRITFSNEISACEAPIIIEAIIEKTEAKSALFLELARVNNEDTVYASNSSSLSITRIAEQTPFPERILGLHFFNPANRMKLVEIIRTKYTLDPIVRRLQAFAMQLKKTAVVCQDSPGFIVNRVARPYYLEALRLVEQRVADMDVIDKLMESAGFPMGPFHLMDLIGLDINYSVSSSVYEALARPARMKPSPLQKALVQEGALGKKTGRGFFHYLKSSNE
jgi:3-hydroxybutyryl-CoA dehydrogenase